MDERLDLAKTGNAASRPPGDGRYIDVPAISKIALFLSLGSFHFLLQLSIKTPPIIETGKLIGDGTGGESVPEGSFSFDFIELRRELFPAKGLDQKVAGPDLYHLGLGVFFFVFRDDQNTHVGISLLDNAKPLEHAHFRHGHIADDDGKGCLL